MLLRFWTMVIAVTLGGCSYKSDKFNREVWLANDDMTDQWNPRARMIKDLLESYLIPGLHRDSILTLLGPPYLEQVENRLPKGLEVPDSLSLVESKNLKEEDRTKALDSFNEWYRANGQPDTLILYPVGWSTIDPNFLVIKLRLDSTAYE